MMRPSFRPVETRSLRSNAIIHDVPLLGCAAWRTLAEIGARIGLALVVPMLACSSSGEQIGFGGPAEDASGSDSTVDNGDSQETGVPRDASVDQNTTPCSELDDCA